VCTQQLPHFSLTLHRQAAAQTKPTQTAQPHWPLIPSAHPHQLVRPVRRSDAQLLQQLNNQPAEALERARQPHFGVDLDQHVFGGVDVEGLELAGLVEGAVQDHHKRLVWGWGVGFEGLGGML